ncbi:hypothetical protein U1Q18_044750 [Sarracenia purpurea var. burkii]
MLPVRHEPANCTDDLWLLLSGAEPLSVSLSKSDGQKDSAAAFLTRRQSACFGKRPTSHGLWTARSGMEKRSRDAHGTTDPRVAANSSTEDALNSGQ